MSSFEEDFSNDEDYAAGNEVGANGRRRRQPGKSFQTPAERRAHHNALERQRREEFKESIELLEDAVPGLRDDKVSRTQKVIKAADHLRKMHNRISGHRADIEKLNRQNVLIERQIESLEMQVLASGGSLPPPPPPPPDVHEVVIVDEQPGPSHGRKRKVVK